MSTNSSYAKICYRGTPLRNIRNFNATPENHNSSVIRGITPDKLAIGFRKGQKPNYSITFDYEVLESNIDPANWEQLKRTQEEFDLSRDFDAESEIYDPCMVADVSGPTDDDGATVKTVTILALKQNIV